MVCTTNPWFQTVSMASAFVCKQRESQRCIVVLSCNIVYRSRISNSMKHLFCIHSSFYIIWSRNAITCSPYLDKLTCGMSGRTRQRPRRCILPLMPRPYVAADDAPKHKCLFLFEKHRRHEYSASNAVNIQGYASQNSIK